MMHRRAFTTLLATASAAWPRATRAQQRKVPLIGFLGTVTQAAWSQPVAAFEQRLGELGWIKGRTIDIDYRWTDGRNIERAPELAEELVRRKVDVIVTGGNAMAAVMRATASIPIVFTPAVDPLGSGFVASLSHPGGNVTGMSLQGPDLAGKRLALLREAVPKLRRLAILVNVTYPAANKELAECQAAARALGLEVTLLELKGPDDIAPAIDSLHGGADALYVVTEAVANAYQVRIAALALAARLPIIFGVTDLMRASTALMAYGPNLPGMFRRVGEYVDKILHGAKPGDIPVEQPTNFELVINLKTAKALDITVPPSVLALANDVIE